MKVIMENLLLTTDLHLTDRKRDIYRFDLFSFLKKQIKKHKVDALFILGDVTDFKDKHPSNLVNKITRSLHSISITCPVYILMGNHDYSNPENPFFGFLSKFKNIHFITKPTLLDDNIFMIPHTHNEEEWNKLRCDTKPDWAFIHQTVTGSVSESGKRLDGFSLKPLKSLKARGIYAGDVHRPHTVENLVTYVGPPYHIRFGDDFNPRCLLLNTKSGKTKNLYMKSPKKWSLEIRSLEELHSLDLSSGDQVKVTFELPREEVVEWEVHKKQLIQEMKTLGLDNHGIDLKRKPDKKRREKNFESLKNKLPDDILLGFCKREKITGRLRSMGKQLLMEN